MTWPLNVPAPPAEPEVYYPLGLSPNERAFSAGCEARRAGRPKSANPFNATQQRGEWLQWRLGHSEVTHFYACEAHWPVTPLPVVENRR